MAAGVVAVLALTPLSVQSTDPSEASIEVSPDYLKARELRIGLPARERHMLTTGWTVPAQGTVFRLSWPTGSGVDLDAGIFQYGTGPGQDFDYKGYFFGLSYRDFNGGVWYTNDELPGKPVTRLAAGWTRDTGANFSFSVHMGSTGYRSHPALTRSTNLGLGARRQFGNIGLDVRLIDQGLIDTPEGGRVRLFGTVSAELE